MQKQLATGPCSSIPSQAAQEREAQLADELAVLSGELARTRAVAARATAREVGNGTKDEGIVPMTMHLEDVTLPFTLGETLWNKHALTLCVPRLMGPQYCY